MQLTYRGNSYNYDAPKITTSTSDTVGRYRGLDVRFRNPQKATVLSSNLDLVYRGVAYATNPEAETPTTTVPSPSVQERSRNLLQNRHRQVKQRQQAMMGRLAAEVGLSTDHAARYWNHVQGKVHPSFWATYSRSHATVS